MPRHRSTKSRFSKQWLHGILRLARCALSLPIGHCSNGQPAQRAASRAAAARSAGGPAGPSAALALREPPRVAEAAAAEVEGGAADATGTLPAALASPLERLSKNDEPKGAGRAELPELPELLALSTLPELRVRARPARASPVLLPMVLLLLSALPRSSIPAFQRCCCCTPPPAAPSRDSGGGSPRARESVSFRDSPTRSRRPCTSVPLSHCCHSPILAVAAWSGQGGPQRWRARGTARQKQLKSRALLSSFRRHSTSTACRGVTTPQPEAKLAARLASSLHRAHSIRGSSHGARLTAVGRGA